MRKTAKLAELTPSSSIPPKHHPIIAEIIRNRQLYLMVAIPVIYIFIFKYVPMTGVQIAFRNYSPTKGAWGSDWVGLKHFIRFFSNPSWFNIVKNTLAISIYSLLFSIPFPILLAIGLEYTRSRAFKKTVQLTTYLPNFLSVVIVVGMLNLLFSNRIGAMNNLVEMVIGHKINFLGDPKYFRSMYVWSGIWQSTGWSSILYIAALSGVDPQIHEAAIIDGANKVRRIWHIDLTSIRPTIMIMFIQSMGTVLTVGFDKTFLMQNTTNLSISEVLSTYEYKSGIGGLVPNYSYGTAVGLMTALSNFIMIWLSNFVSNKLTGSGLW